jgi:hypothetical protein
MRDFCSEQRISFMGRRVHHRSGIVTVSIWGLLFQDRGFELNPIRKIAGEAATNEM